MTDITTLDELGAAGWSLDNAAEATFVWDGDTGTRTPGNYTASKPVNGVFARQHGETLEELFVRVSSWETANDAFAPTAVPVEAVAVEPAAEVVDGTVSA